VFADGPVFAGNLNLFFLLVWSFSEDRSTLAAVQSGPFCNALELAEEMIVRAGFFIDEDPAVVWGVPAPVL